jgi:hypothetical protein
MNSQNIHAWHSKKPNVANVYHNNPKCEAGNRIETQQIQQGTGGRPLCRRCNALNTALPSQRSADDVGLLSN